MTAIHHCKNKNCKWYLQTLSWSNPPAWLLKQIKDEGYKNIKIRYEKN